MTTEINQYDNHRSDGNNCCCLECGSNVLETELNTNLKIECEGCGMQETCNECKGFLMVLVIDNNVTEPKMKFYCHWCLPFELIGEAHSQVKFQNMNCNCSILG